MPPFRFSAPNSPVHLSVRWIHLRDLAGANQEFSPLEIKGAYTVGLLDDICRSVEWLLSSHDAWPEKYLPAFSLFASGIDLFGRCLTGNTTFGTNQNLKVGYWYLFNNSTQPPPMGISNQIASEPVITSQSLSYSIDHLVTLRNYCTHGQAARKELPGVDNLLLEKFPQLIGNAIETFWSGLLEESEYCIRLGRARLDPFSTRVDPLVKALKYFAEGLAVGDLFFNLKWNVL